MSPEEERLMRERNAAIGGGGFLYTVMVVCAVMFAANRNRNSTTLQWLGAMFMAVFGTPLYLTYATATCFIKSRQDEASFFKSSCFDFGKQVEVKV